VRADQVIGSVMSDGVASAASEAGDSAQPASPAASTPPADTTEAETTTASSGESARPADDVNSRSPAPPVNQGMSSGTAVIKDAAGNVLASTEGATGASGADTATGGATQATGSNKAVLASGPGYSISAGEPRTNRPIRLAEASALKSPANAAVERRYEPMICQGSRLLHIDGRNLEFEGDAVSALDGCEIHITNSHIIARGVGISARAANVHIKNSIIEGASGSISASGGAKVYTQQSTFKGLSRRLDTSTFHDLGGTVWN
jgi:hypothetical protein